MSKISELSDGGALQSTDYLIAVRSGGNVKVRPNGAVSGTTGQFSTSLNVDGTVTADGLAVDGAASIGSSTAKTKFYSDSTYSGIFNGASLSSNESFYMGAGGLFFYGGGSERMRITSAGNVGIGTGSPETNLHVVGPSNTSTTVQISSATSGYAPILNFDGVVGAAADNLLGQISASWDTHTNEVAAIRFESGSDTANKDDGLISFWTSDAGSVLDERMRITSAGNVGIGTSNPVYDFVVSNGGAEGLEISAGGISSNRINTIAYNRSTSAYADMYMDAANIILLPPGGGGGNLMVGTTSSGFNGQGLPLVVGSGSGNTGMTIYSGATGYGTIQFADAETTGAGSYAGVVSYNHNSDFMYFSTAASERMRIDSSGNLLVGTTTSSSPASGVVITPSFTSADASGIAISHPSGTSSGAVYGYFFYNSTGIGSITQNGTTGVLYNTSSDYRLKDVDGPITNSGAYIDALKPVQGSWKADGSRFIGLIAHEVQEVSETPIATGEKDGEEMQGMDYSAPELIANLIAEIQSLRARVAQLEGA